MGFQELLDERIHTGYIITSYHYPEEKEFDFKDFYTRLQVKGMWDDLYKKVKTYFDWYCNFPSWADIKPDVEQVFLKV